jgi:ribosomal protein L40E
MADTKQCLRCGADKLEFGRLNGYSSVTFTSWAKTLFGLPFGPRESLSAYACRNCGHVELVLNRVKA